MLWAASLFLALPVVSAQSEEYGQCKCQVPNEGQPLLHDGANRWLQAAERAGRDLPLVFLGPAVPILTLIIRSVFRALVSPPPPPPAPAAHAAPPRQRRTASPHPHLAPFRPHTHGLRPARWRTQRLATSPSRTSAMSPTTASIWCMPRTSTMPETTAA
jgi:hypothetical protein